MTTAPTPDVLERLAERCETASGPDRELDGLIFKAVYEKPGDFWTDDFGPWYRRDPEDHIAFESPPDFTRSLDSAMALVPEGAVFNLGNDIGPCWADVWNKDIRSFAFNARSKSPALALTAACLRAKAALCSGVGAMTEFCGVCGSPLNFTHDHKPDNSGLDDGPEIRPARKKPATKPSDEMRDIRNRAWATRREKYGEHGHR